MEFNGLNYIEAGQGKPILLLHGWGANVDVWHSIMQEFSLEYHVYALDLYGFGKSREPSENFTIYDYARVVDDFITKIIGKPVILVGHSFGGRIGLILGDSKNVDALVLVDSAGIKPRFNLKKYIKVRCYKKLKQKVQQGVADGGKLEKFGSSDYKNLSKTMRQVFVNVVNEDLTKLAKNVSKLTLLLWGRKDKETPSYMARKLRRNIKNSRLVYLNGGHFSFLDDKDNFIKECYKFFDKRNERNV